MPHEAALELVRNPRWRIGRDLALQHGNLLVAEATAKELPPLNLMHALELTIGIAGKDPRRHPRVAARWLLRYLEERPDVTIDEAALVAASLAALTGRGRKTAVETLRATAEAAAGGAKTEAATRAASVIPSREEIGARRAP